MKTKKLNRKWMAILSLGLGLAAVALVLAFGGSHVSAAPALPPDLRVAAVESADPVIVGDNLTYFITVSNWSQGVFHSVVATATLPNIPVHGFPQTSKGHCFWRVYGDTVWAICPMGDFAFGERAHITITVKPNAVGVITSVVEAWGNSSDLYPPNNTVILTTDVVSPGPHIEISHDEFSATVRPGEEVDFWWYITNTGTADLYWQSQVVPDQPCWVEGFWGGGFAAPGYGATLWGTLDSSCVGPGVYTRTLQITSNDPDRPTLTLPINMTVQQHIYLPLVVRDD